MDRRVFRAVSNASDILGELVEDIHRGAVRADPYVTQMVYGAAASLSSIENVYWKEEEAKHGKRVS